MTIGVRSILGNLRMKIDISNNGRVELYFPSFCILFCENKVEFASNTVSAHVQRLNCNRNDKKELFWAAFCVDESFVFSVFWNYGFSLPYFSFERLS